MTDSQIVLTVSLLLAAHVAAIIATIVRRHRGVAPLLAVNLIVAAIVLIAIGSRGRYLFTPPDWPVLALAAGECGVIALSLATWRRARRGYRGLSIGIFALHLLATTAALIFMLTFSMTRLI